MWWWCGFLTTPTKVVLGCWLGCGNRIASFSPLRTSPLHSQGSPWTCGTFWPDHVLHLLVWRQGIAGASRVGLLSTVEDNLEHVELVLIDQHLHLLEHVKNLLVWHQGTVGARLVGVLLPVEDNPVHVDCPASASAASCCESPYMSPKQCRSPFPCEVSASPNYEELKYVACIL